MSDAAGKPVLWVSLTSAGRGYATEDSMAELSERLEEHLGEDYEIVVADDRVRLMDREELEQMFQELQEALGQYAHEDALFSAATEGDSEE